MLLCHHRAAHLSSSTMLFANEISSSSSLPRMHPMSHATVEGSNQPLNLSRASSGPSKLKAKLSARHHRAMSAGGHSPPPPPSSTSPSPSSSPSRSGSTPQPRLHVYSAHHHHHHHHHHHDRELSCSCPQQDSKNTILYRLLTDSYSYWTPVCCIGGKCHNGQIMGQSKLKILLEESKRQAVQ